MILSSKVDQLSLFAIYSSQELDALEEIEPSCSKGICPVRLMFYAQTHYCYRMLFFLDYCEGVNPVGYDLIDQRTVCLTDYCLQSKFLEFQL